MAFHPATSINLSRLRELLDGINQFGREDDSPGLNRPAFSESDMAARRWLVGQIEDAGLHADIDAAGNVIGTWRVEGDAPLVMVGSHTDTVIAGGAYDGALGVAVGLECIKAMKEAGVAPARSIAVVSTSDEEGRFGGMLGSEALAGIVTEEWVQSSVDADGIRLWDVMSAAGFDPARVSRAALAKGSVAAFVELHIEQGPTLEKAGKPIGLVDVISGVCNWTIRLKGVANHAGSTPMAERADAFAGLAEVAVAIPEVIAAHGTDYAKITIGKVDLQPNTPHTIPGEAEFSVIFKEAEEAAMRRLADGFAEHVRRAAQNHRLEHEIEEHSWLPPVALDTDLRQAVREAAEAKSIDYLVLPSGGAHDAQTMTALCPTALIFVPSKGGVSHSPDEQTSWDDIAIGADLMLATLMRLTTSTRS